MRILVWLADGTWESCVDAARTLDGGVTLLYVVDVDTVAAMSGPVGLLGRSGQAPAGEMLADAGTAHAVRRRPCTVRSSPGLAVVSRP